MAEDTPATNRLATALRRTLFLGVELRPGETLGVLAMFSSLYMILFTAYLLKPAREMLILTEGTAEIRSYAVALQAALLMFFVPIYGKLSRRYYSENYMEVVTVICVATLLLFFFAGKTGVSISILYFVWLGAYSVLMIAQFWAFASELYSREAGERLFVIVALGASLGAWSGSALSRELVNYLDAYGLILCAALILLFSIVPARRATLSVPESSRGTDDVQTVNPSMLAGFHLVFSRHYLRLLALFVILVNLINSTGEYLLAAILEQQYLQETLAGTTDLDKGTYVGRFYGGFYLMVNFCGVVIQYFVVSRVLRFAGIGLAVALTPLVVFLGYTSLALIPMLGWFRYFKIVENSLDYSLQNTVRQMLYLPLSRQEKYEARAVIDPLGQRFGDLLQALLIFYCLNYLQWQAQDFLPMVAVIAAVALLIAIGIIRSRKRLLAEAKTRS